MSNNIGWCDCTINPVVGCTKCSPGCTNCYAEKFAYRMSRNPQTGRKYEGVVDANGKWTGKVNVALDAKTMPHRVPGKNKRVFVGSMSDLFHPNVSDATRDVIFASILGDHIIGNSRRHTFLILTKRAEEMCDYFTLTPPDELLHRWGEAGAGWLTLEGDTSFSEHLESHLSYYGWETFWPLPNLWLEATVCNQQEVISKIPVLLDTPAEKRFLSVEPMLGAVDLTRFLPALDWVICGGETGPKARPMHSDWVRLLRISCMVAGVPFYFKGWGEWLPCSEVPDDMDVSGYPVGDIGDDGIFIPPPALEIPMRNGVCHEDTFRVGKNKSGHLLDGKEWREFPAQEVSR